MSAARPGPARPAPARGFERRLLIVEDQALLRDLLASAFTQRGFSVAAAGSAADAARIARSFDPDGVLLDIDLGDGPDGVEVAHALLRRFPYLAVAFLTDAVDPRVAHAAPLPNGATVAYLGKTGLTDLDRLFDAMEAALTDASGARYRDDARGDRSFAGLTDPQLQVLALAAGGCSNLVIAEIRGTTERSVERILAAAYLALGIDPGPRTNQRVAAVTRFLAAGGRALVPGATGDGRPGA
ncbi:MAG: response regulator [Chloroflexota bacterium]